MRLRSASLMVLLSLLHPTAAFAQTSVTIGVGATKQIGSFKPIYAYIGYDEPNYTYTRNSSKLIGELALLTDAPVYIRTPFLLATGDGTPGLKWGSTDAPLPH